MTATASSTAARATVVDGIVMASAALRGDMVDTSGFDHLTGLRAYSPAVCVLGI